MVQSQPGQIPQKKNITKKGWWSDSRVGLSSNPNTTKKKTKKKEKTLIYIINLERCLIYKLFNLWDIKKHLCEHSSEHNLNHLGYT
jgi:hypothetical protein